MYRVETMLIAVALPEISSGTKYALPRGVMEVMINNNDLRAAYGCIRMWWPIKVCRKINNFLERGHPGAGTRVFRTARIVIMASLLLVTGGLCKPAGRMPALPEKVVTFATTFECTRCAYAPAGNGV